MTMRTRRFFALALLLPAACGRRESGARPAAGAKSPPTVAPIARTSLPVRRDSAFDANGVFVPDSDLVIGGYQVSFLNITPNFALLRLVRSADTRDWAKRACSGAITRDTVDLVCPGTPVGDVTLAGAFLDKGRAVEVQRQSLDTKAIVLRALLTARGPAGVIAMPVRFTSAWAGD